MSRAGRIVVAVVGATCAIILVANLAGFAVVADLSARSDDYILRLDRESTVRARANCASQVRNVRALRAVVIEATTPQPVVLPPDPAVPQAVLDYLQRVVNESTSAGSSETRTRLLAVAPSIRCTPNGKVRVLR